MIEENIEKLARDNGFFDDSKSDLLNHVAGQCIKNELLDKSEEATTMDSIWTADQEQWTVMQTESAQQERELNKKVAAVYSKIKGIEIPGNGAEGQKLDRYQLVSDSFGELWAKIAPRTLDTTTSYIALRYLKKQIKDTLFGFGPLQDLLRTPAVSEIMVVDSSNIYIERNGDLQNSGRRFLSDDVTVNIIRRIVSKVQRDIDMAKPLVDARLPDGSRVNAVIPPIAVRGPCITIRKFPHQRLTIDDLVQKYNSLTEQVRYFLEASVRKKCNILISGGTGSGKTTLLNCLSTFFGDEERIITIEDTAELQIQKKHVVQLETKQASKSGQGEYTIAHLVANSLRMRPNRIIVGEVRGSEAFRHASSSEHRSFRLTFNYP